ncbi:hypothetical protein PYCCODRAFT_1421252 [Trametes coccinea BRFM310]|uniref:6S proteasome subunit Rpn6 C-terminal helix domain-containing protein n=1 Tax=Trametes coccinea (strain BRFM310) TaxID=1353009 RepID=A0A1Y2J7Q6_TRAC3|nr:hypothetical protein PYCCODRAFT_1421252 [Trametes coccinea BRFM310]
MSLRASEFTDTSPDVIAESSPGGAHANYEANSTTPPPSPDAPKLSIGKSLVAPVNMPQRRRRRASCATRRLLWSSWESYTGTRGDLKRTNSSRRAISNAQGITDVIKLSRGNVSSIAKAKTAQLISGPTVAYTFDTGSSTCNQYKPALALTDFSMTELKRLDNTLVLTELASEYAGLRVVESMRAVTRAYQKRNLVDFEKTLHEYRQRCLLIFEEPEADRAYGAAIDTLEQVGKVVDLLYAKRHLYPRHLYQGSVGKLQVNK